MNAMIIAATLNLRFRSNENLVHLHESMEYYIPSSVLMNLTMTIDECFGDYYEHISLPTSVAMTGKLSINCHMSLTNKWRLFNSNYFIDSDENMDKIFSEIERTIMRSHRK